METKYALVLTGSTLPGYAADAVWPALAAYFRMEPAKLTDQVLVRAPLTIKESDELGKLQTLQAGAAAVGAEAEICAPDGRPALFVLLDGTPRGPVPRVFVEERQRRARALARSRNDRRGRLQQLAAFRASRPPAAPVMPAEDIASEPTSPPREAARRLCANDGGGSRPQPRGERRVVVEFAAAVPLPAGAAIHAGFWRRCAAYTIDYFITFVVSYVVGLIAGFGLAAGQAWRACWRRRRSAVFSAPTSAGCISRCRSARRSRRRSAVLALGIKVTDPYGRRSGFGRATGRFFGKILSGIILTIGFMLAGWTEKKQALHDMLAGTFVVFRDVQPGQPPPTVRPPMPWYGWVLNILLIAFIVLCFVAFFALFNSLVGGLMNALRKAQRAQRPPNDEAASRRLR